MPRHLTLWLCLLALPASADIRPISEAERAAVEIAAAYQARGPQAIVDKLATQSPLRKLPAAEIETRIGPAAGTSWELVTVVDALKDKTVAFDLRYPSGIDETVFFDMVREAGVWHVSDVRNLAMPAPRALIFSPLVVPGPNAPPHAFRNDGIAGLMGLFGIVLGAAAALLMRTQRANARPLLLLAFTAAGAAILIAALAGDRLRLRTVSAAIATHHDREPRLARLLALRTALVKGGDGVGQALTNVPSSGYAGDVARLWKAQWDFRQGKTADVERVLATFPRPSNVPLVELLRARLAMVKNDTAGAVVAYQSAINRGPGRDSLWVEAAHALAAAGFDAQATRTLRRVARLGSRDAGTYYTLAALENDGADLDVLLQRAWTLQPVERRGLVSTGVLWSVVRKRGPQFINLSDPREATFAAAGLSSRAIHLPEGTLARVSGDFLHLQSGTAELWVPAGAALAPVNAETVDAGRWSRMEQEEALRDVPELVATAQGPAALGPAAYAQPAVRRRMVAAASALAARNRWDELVTLTKAISPKSEFVPSELFFLRATALQHGHRDDEAKALLLDLGKSPALERKRDAYALEQLGDMLASFDVHDLAINMFERAKRIRAEGYADTRIGQIAMDKRLAKQYATFHSPNFEIHYPPEVSPVTAAAIGQVLEAELQRMQAWVPVKGFRKVTVNIVWWQDFKAVYTGSEDILGFYNGKITLPLAGVYELRPEVVALITHELCHAMIAQASNNQAPRWFHEGLAQRVEMVAYHANAFNMYDDDKLFAVSVLDPVLASSRDNDMIGAGYVVAQTFVRYIEQRLGARGIHALLARFAAGATEEEAIGSVSGVPLADFDAAFRKWGRAESRVFENAAPVRYDRALIDVKRGGTP